MNVGGLELGYLNVAMFGLAIFLFMGVISFIRQGLKIAAFVLLALTALAALAGAMWL